jgi:dolichol-phosphate mannosyltransferase
MKYYSEKYDWIKIVKLSKNFGHEASMKAGIEHASGDAICVLDADLQHPVDIALKLVDEILAGKDIIFGKRKKDKNMSLRKICNITYYYLLKKLTGLPFQEDFSDFFAISLRVREYVLKLQEQYNFIRGQIMWPFDRIDYIEYEERDRKHGKTKYNFTKLISVAIYSIFTYSKIPVTYFIFSGLFSIMIAVYIVLKSTYEKYILKLHIEGFPTIYSLFMLIIGVNMIFYSIIIEYIMLIFQQQKNKPTYFILEKVNFQNKGKEE